MCEYYEVLHVWHSPSPGVSTIAWRPRGKYDYISHVCGKRFPRNGLHLRYVTAIFPVTVIQLDNLGYGFALVRKF